MPTLTVIAGCNGSGKSTFASSFLREGLVSFDYDKVYLHIYSSLQECEFRDEMARNMTTQLFEEQVKESLNHKLDFCYETNFDTFPLHWPKIYKEQGYTLNMIFFCLDNQEIARERVLVRSEFHGHFVDNETIDLKWKEGYKNLNLYHSFFDRILFVDNSVNNEVYTNLLQIEDGETQLMCEQLPDYFSRRFPDIYLQIRSQLL